MARSKLLPDLDILSDSNKPERFMKKTDPLTRSSAHWKHLLCIMLVSSWRGSQISPSLITSCPHHPKNKIKHNTHRKETVKWELCLYYGPLVISLRYLCDMLNLVWRQPKCFTVCKWSDIKCGLGVINGRIIIIYRIVIELSVVIWVFYITTAWQVITYGRESVLATSV